MNQAQWDAHERTYCERCEHNRKGRNACPVKAVLHNRPNDTQAPQADKKAWSLLAVHAKARAKEGQEADQEEEIAKEKAMPKKDKTDMKVVESNVIRLSDLIAHMVGDSEFKSDTGISRKESAALSYALSRGIVLGFALATDKKVRKSIMRTDDNQMSSKEILDLAGRVMNTAIEEYPKEREKLLGLNEKGGALKVTIEQLKEVR